MRCLHICVLYGVAYIQLNRTITKKVYIRPDLFNVENDIIQCMHCTVKQHHN